ncbi:uncharacterized protein LOC131690189 [Topomyia yanbarensis]|uniref:uncharacterized protein LOC131690189 n=1 Tax=Topomyia yanbarensis TaxID=2498891 RepID=UPI00273C7721|nr:uncharacterized protein LOC131690189 [Topomyia yanbarensis]XP_058831749.1 uncharacterized protein LOC131690189 [Topomyia yanbarensis]XP_058831750.1 uncharacterized protein LOC131690189 [Topomyia yanbarensis]
MDIEIKNEPVIIEGYELVDHFTDRSSNSGTSSYKPPQQTGHTDVIYVSNETGFPNDEMLLLLQQWGLEMLSDRFTHNLIDVSLLDYMLDVDIIDICKGLPMRYRIVLRQKLQQKSYKKQDHESERSKADSNSAKVDQSFIAKRSEPTNIVSGSSQDTSTSISQPSAACASKTKPKLDRNAKSKDSMPEYAPLEPIPIMRHRESLLEICKWHEMGRKFLEHYRIENGKRIYSAVSRKYIKNAIVEYFLRIGKGHIAAQTFTTMVQIILDELPDEDPRIWYNPPFNGMSPGGLLYSRYRYLTQKDKRYRNQKSDPVVPHAASVLEQAERCWNGLSKEAQMDCTDAKVKLRHAANMNKSEIYSAWKTSFPIRRYEAVTKGLRLDEWEVLASYEEIHELISYDFCAIHSNEHDCIRDRIPQFVTQFFDIYQSYKASIDDDKQLASALLSSFSKDVEVNDKSIFLAFYALPLILRQTFIVRGRKRSKPSVKSGRATFIVLLETEAGITENIAQRKRIAAEDGNAELWPYIIAIGNTQSQAISGYFVVLDSTIFKCKSMVDAVDLLFKIYTVFNLEYAYACESVLKFIQQYFYNLIYDGARQDSNVVALITDLNRSLN